MAWSRAKLEKVAHDRLAQRTQLAPVERAALAYARRQGLTDEEGIDPVAAEASLGEALRELDNLEPEAWDGIAQLADDLGDAAIIGLMKHSMARGLGQMREAEADRHHEENIPDLDAEAPVVKRAPKRRKGKSL